MFFRNFSVAALVSVLASGVWYYRQDSSIDTRSGINGTAPLSGIHTVSQQLPANTPPPLPAPQSSETLPISNDVAAQTKTVIPVDDENFYLAEIEDRPLVKQVEDEGAARMEKLSPEQATQRLRRLEKSYSVGRGRGVVRYDLVQIPSNNPIEDDHAEKIVDISQNVTPAQADGSSNDWMFWGVFDGHSGWTTSAKLRQQLISYVTWELNTVYKSAVTDPSINIPSPLSVNEAIKRGFLKLDNDIVHTSVQLAMSKKGKAASTELLAPALSGACALLSFYDSSSKLFRVACTGDSRAVLGRKGVSGKWTATPLSEDQTGGTPSEIERLRKEHPGEKEVTLNGRILGSLEPSRAFGDAVYKWSKDTQSQIRQRFFGRSPSPRLKTPPYVTAEPIITTTKIEPESGDFVVLATDGLWEMLTNEEVVGLVGRWIEKQQNASSGSSPLAWAKYLAGRSDSSLPVERLQIVAQGEEGQRAPIRQEQWSIAEGDDRFVTEDKNVATHLVRNALGGRDRDMVCSLLSLVSPYSRRYRYVIMHKDLVKLI